MGFTEMLSRAPDLALAWRMATREIFTTYFARGYRAVEFFLDRPARKGAYLLMPDGLLRHLGVGVFFWGGVWCWVWGVWVCGWFVGWGGGWCGGVLCWWVCGWVLGLGCGGGWWGGGVFGGGGVVVGVG